MRKKPFIVIGIGALVAGLAVWGFLAGREELAIEQKREKPVNAPSRVVAQDGGTALVFDADTQKRADIAVAAVQQTARRGEIAALAAVLPLQELIDLRNAFVAATAQLERTRAAMEASRREFERIEALHNDDSNVSDKVLEAARATWRGDEAVARAAAEALGTVERGARQKWGAALVEAMAKDTPLFRDLAEQRQVLLRVAVSAGSSLAKPPVTVRVDAGDGAYRTGKLISAAPQADPRTQGPTFFYAASTNGLLPGTTLTANLPAGAEQPGGIVPADAVVWWQGKSWVYLQSAPDRFVRRELPPAMAIDQGWFVPGGFQGARLVVRGAQSLLSEELRAQIQVGEEGE
ncbi:hypothetical protein [Thiobacillus sp. 0-1251]|uniref:hypothetical protein n=1 Tax=Thiobacillus sp. 0-1251 TaxID=1895858 RepID=UPI00095F22B8|nr:hypothetical protein [Thiobacillus sp. 0-1251]OJY58432.1 MAG: hypothetical protein BGP19_17435 [Thiobacillus sp. 0-1251]